MQTTNEMTKQFLALLTLLLAGAACEAPTAPGEHDSLVTKCPSKFQEQAAEDPEHVVIEE